MNATPILLLALILAVARLGTAQKQAKPKSRSPFQSPVNEDFQPIKKHRQEPEKSPPQSPFTPPRDIVVRELTTTRTEATASPTTTAATDATQGVPENQASNVGSPFRPPVKSEWREQPLEKGAGNSRKNPRISKGKSSPWLHSVEERQRDNVDSIPPLANIDVSDNRKDSATNTRKRFKVKSKPVVSEDKGHRDIHDAEPGVTPWTRYTDKPRVKEEHAGSGKANARCGRLRYAPRNQICCQGNVLRRHGVSPACCGGEAYDTVYNKCCDGVISARTNGQSDC